MRRVSEFLEYISGVSAYIIGRTESSYAFIPQHSTVSSSFVFQDDAGFFDSTRSRNIKLRCKCSTSFDDLRQLLPSNYPYLLLLIKSPPHISQMSFTISKVILPL